MFSKDSELDRKEGLTLVIRILPKDGKEVV
jgi:hypothetical protein